MKRCVEEQGTVIVLVAFLLVVFLALVALVVDIGMLYLEKIELVNILDAVVLSGVQELPDNSQLAKEIALDYAQDNGLSSAQINVSVIDSNEIKAQGSQQVAMKFATIFGINEVQITRSSRAKVGEVSGITGAVPFGVVKQNFNYGEKYYLKYGAGGSELADGRNGNFGALSLGGTGASNYEENIKDGHDQSLRVGDSVTTEPGNMAGPTRKGVEYRIDQEDHVPECTYDAVESGCSRLLYVPVIDDLGSGRSTAEVVGFAAFFLEGMAKDSGNSYVEGRFIKSFADEAEMGSSGQNFGLRKVKLVD
ncbi:MAG: Tad domain-containing protein [Bacillota bacterium]